MSLFKSSDPDKQKSGLSLLQGLVSWLTVGIALALLLRFLGRLEYVYQPACQSS